MTLAMLNSMPAWQGERTGKWQDDGIWRPPCAYSPFLDALHPSTGNTPPQTLPEIHRTGFILWVNQYLELLFFQHCSSRERWEKIQMDCVDCVNLPLPLWREPGAEWSSPMQESRSFPQSTPHPSSLCLMPPSLLLFTFRENSSETEQTNTKPAAQITLTRSSTEVPIDPETLPNSQDLTKTTQTTAIAYWSARSLSLSRTHARTHAHKQRCLEIFSPKIERITNRNGCNANKQNKQKGLETLSTKLKGRRREMGAMQTTARNKMQGFQKHRPPSRQKIRNRVAHSRYETKNRESWGRERLRLLSIHSERLRRSSPTESGTRNREKDGDSLSLCLDGLLHSRALPSP